MRITEGHWQRFSTRFAETVDAYLAEREFAAKLAQLEADLKAVQRADTAPAGDQIDKIEAAALNALVEAERIALGDRVQGSTTWRNLFEIWTEGTQIREADGAPLRVAFQSRDFMARETEGLTQFIAMRGLIRAAAQKQRDRVAAGELAPAQFSAKTKAAEEARLSEQIASVKAKLAEAVAELAPFRDGRHDGLAGMLREYANAQALAKFPLEPLARIKTHPAYGGVTDMRHPDAARVAMPADDPRLPAWGRLRDFVAGKDA